MVKVMQVEMCQMAVHPLLGQGVPLLPVRAHRERGKRKGSLWLTCTMLSSLHPWLSRQQSWVGCCLLLSPLFLPGTSTDMYPSTQILFDYSAADMCRSIVKMHVEEKHSPSLYKI